MTALSPSDLDAIGIGSQQTERRMADRREDSLTRLLDASLKVQGNGVLIGQRQMHARVMRSLIAAGYGSAAQLVRGIK